MPLPVFAGLLWPRRWSLAAPGGVALSGLIVWLMVVGGRRLFGR